MDPPPRPPRPAFAAQLADAVARPLPPRPPVILPPRPAGAAIAVAAAAAAAQRAVGAAAAARPVRQDHDERFRWQPGQGMVDLEDDQPSAVFMNGLSRFGAAVAGLGAISPAISRVPSQIAKLKTEAVLVQVDPVKRELLVLSPAPDHRMPEEAARALHQRVQAIKALPELTDIGDQDVWRAGCGWPANKANRLALGLAALDATRTELASLRDVLQRLGHRPPPDPGMGTPAPQSSAPATPAPATPADIDAVLKAAQRVHRSPLKFYRQVDGPCCYIEDMSQPLFDESLSLLRTAAKVVWDGMGAVLAKLKLGGGTAFDRNTLVRRVRDQASTLGGLHDQLKIAQYGRTRWSSRRAEYSRREFMVLSNDPYAWGSPTGVALEVALLADEEATQEEVHAFGMFGGLLQSDGSPVPAGLFEEDIRALLSAVARASTAEAVTKVHDEEVERRGVAWGMLYQGLSVSSSASPSDPLSSGPSLSDDDKAHLTGALELLRAGRGKALVDKLTTGAYGPSLLHAVSPSGMSIVKLACSLGDVPVVSAALALGYDPAFVHPDGSTVLHLAASKGGPVGLELLRCCLAALGKTIAARTHQSGTSALGPAMPKGPVMDGLKSTLDRRNSTGVAALHLAARNSVSSTSETLLSCVCLLQAGADILLPDGSGQSAALLLARRCGTGLGQSASEAAAPMPQTSLLSRYLFNTALSDVTVTAEGQAIPAHRVVLASASGVWRTMFEGGWAESQAGASISTDISEPCLRNILRWAYTGSLGLAPGDAQAGLEALAAAVHLDMPQLCKEAQGALLAALDVTTAMAVFDTSRALGLPARPICRAAATFILLAATNGPKSAAPGQESDTEAWACLVSDLMQPDTTPVGSSLFPFMGHVHQWLERCSDRPDPWAPAPSEQLEPRLLHTVRAFLDDEQQ